MAKNTGLTRAQRALRAAQLAVARESAMPIKRYHQCPFCPPIKGEIGVDVNGIIDWLLENPTSTEAEDYELHSARETLVFAPKMKVHSPCDHLVAVAYSPTLCAVWYCIGSTIIDYEHPWFRALEPDLRLEYSQFVFERHLNSQDDLHDPEFGRLAKYWTDEWLAYTDRDGFQLDLHVMGHAYFVERPTMYFNKLPQAFAAWVNEATENRGLI